MVVVGPAVVVAGAITWATVSKKLRDENITVADDAKWFGGAVVDGPLTAFAQADIIDQHARHISSGKTYAELAQNDPIRPTMMNASFLRASLFTSVLSFGVAAMAMGMGVLTTALGHSILSSTKR
jgi:hypothetical protein